MRRAVASGDDARRMVRVVGARSMGGHRRELREGHTVQRRKDTMPWQHLVHLDRRGALNGSVIFTLCSAVEHASISPHPATLAVMVLKQSTQ